MKLFFALLSDAVDREVNAFGGARSFLRKLSLAHVDETNLPTPLRKKL